LKKNPDAASGSNGEILGAIFGVLGFTLAFLFGMSLTRMEHKKEMVTSEASAILGAYENARFLPEQQQAAAVRMLKTYAELRYKLATEARETRNVQVLREGILLSERIQDSLLAEGKAAKMQPNADASNFIQSIISIADLNMRRVNNSMDDRIPATLKVLMYVMALMGLAGMGYGSGLKGGRSLIPNIILVVVFAVIMGMIIDMDHPANALFKVSQQPMLEVIRKMGAMRF
jgi:hypothetical protein